MAISKINSNSLNTDEATLSFSTSGTERMRIDSSGNLNFVSSGSTLIDLNFTDVELNNYARIEGGKAGSGIGDLRFYTYSGGLSESMRIDSSGNLLVGTTSFTGSGASSGKQVIQFSGATQNGLYLDDTRTTSGSDNAIVFGRGATYCGKIETTLSPATNYLSASDYRLKEDVQPMTGATERVKALNPVNFAWKADGSRVDGFLAHEAQEVVPAAVSGEKDAVDIDGNPQHQSIDQSKLVPLLTAALQEAIAEIETLKTKVAALENA